MTQLLKYRHITNNLVVSANACSQHPRRAGRIIASTMSRTIESLCTKCGAPTEVGLIFCKNCGAALGLTDSLIRPLSQTEIGPSGTGKFLSGQWVVLALLFVFFPILFHPWWLFPVTLAAFGFLVWLLLQGKEASK